MHNIFMKIKVIYIFGFYIYAFADISLFSFIFYLWRTYSFIRKKILYGTGNVRMHYSFFLKLKTFIFMVKNTAFAGPSLYLPLFLDIWKTCTFKREKIPNKNFIDTTHKSSWWFLRGWPHVSLTRLSRKPSAVIFFMNYVQSIIHEYIKRHIHVPLSADWLSCVLDEWICVFYMHPIVKLSTIIKECAVSNLQSVSNIFKDCIFFFKLQILNVDIPALYSHNDMSIIFPKSHLIMNGRYHCWVEGLVCKSIWIYVLNPLCAI